MRGRLMFHPAQPDREYSLGFNHECDFLVPHGLGILAGALHLSALPVIIHAWPEASSRFTCFIHKDSNGRLFLRPAAQSDRSDGV